MRFRDWVLRLGGIPQHPDDDDDPDEIDVWVVVRQDEPAADHEEGP